MAIKLANFKLRKKVFTKQVFAQPETNNVKQFCRDELRMLVAKASNIQLKE
jgi:hypothetical protein